MNFSTHFFIGFTEISSPCLYIFSRKSVPVLQWIFLEWKDRLLIRPICLSVVSGDPANKVQDKAKTHRQGKIYESKDDSSDYNSQSFFSGKPFYQLPNGSLCPLRVHRVTMWWAMIQTAEGLIESLKVTDVTWDGETNRRYTDNKLPSIRTEDTLVGYRVLLPKRSTI